jgi:GNAT superfamily N-acetyltransferase
VKLAFRPATPDERRCLCPGRPEDSRECSPIVSLWSSSYKTSHYAGLIWHEDWAATMHASITKILARQARTAIIAYEQDDPTFLYGFIVGDMTGNVPVIDYVFVKEPYRRNGIARTLFAELGVAPSERFAYSCKTRIVTQLAAKIPAARYDNLQARYPKEERRRRL